MKGVTSVKLSDVALKDVKEFLRLKPAYAEYKSGSSWYKTGIYETAIMPDGRVGIYILFDHEAPNRISEIKFFDRAGNLFASGTENINKEAFDEGVLYRFAITVEQTGFTMEAAALNSPPPSSGGSIYNTDK